MTRTVQEHRWGKVGPVYTNAVHQAQSKRRTGPFLPRQGNWLSFTVTRANSEMHTQQKTTNTAGGPPWDMAVPHWACQDLRIRHSICSHSGIQYFTALSLCTFYLLLKMMFLVFTCPAGHRESLWHSSFWHMMDTWQIPDKGTQSCLFRPYECEKALRIK